MQDSSSQPDKILVPYLTAEEETVAQDCLDFLFRTKLVPLIEEIIGKEFLTLTFDEKKQLCAEAQTACFKFLRSYREKFRSNREVVKPVLNLKAYVTKIVRNARSDLIARKNPDFRRTKHRILYFVKSSKETLITFRDEIGTLYLSLCKFRENQVHKDFQPLIEKIKASNSRRLFMKTHEILLLVLREAACPVSVDDAVRIELEITGVAEVENRSLETLKETLTTNPQNERENHEVLRKLWAEIKLLPVNQRKALLLNMKEAVGVEAISLWLVLGIVTEAGIAEGLEVSPEGFEKLLARLPMSSAEIADELGIKDTEKMTKAEVVDNLRKSARDRLKRRLGKM